MELTINGVPRATASSPVTPLLTVLREDFDITSAKPGCEQGGCGTCTVLVDGAPRRACLVAVGTLGGAEVTTVEGLGGARSLAAIQKAFNDRYAAQCGYCTTGMVMAAQALIDSTDEAVTRDQVLDALSGHVCRCTGYVKIVDAIIAASTGEFDHDDADDFAADPSQPEVEPKGAPA
ncbi:MAG TPA: (2Fe-2S)-binding protein [Solirubrobacteraceae bacterium]|jgi:carbon-monoxide dehydrogenase small subunit|nr:(2Fe-2S)-binding protein [Solirubrobacteraceae bacterium]